VIPYSMRVYVAVRLVANCYIRLLYFTLIYKKHLKNVGPIRHNEPPHAHSADVATGTVVRHLRIDVHNDIDNDDDNDIA